MILKRLSTLARYNVLTPVAILAAIAVSPALAVDQVTPAGTTDTDGVQLAPGDTYTNNGTVTNGGGAAVDDIPDGVIARLTNNNLIQASPGNDAVFLRGGVTLFENNAGASILNAFGDAVFIDGAGAGTFWNDGNLEGADFEAVRIHGGGVTNFTNGANGVIRNVNAFNLANRGGAVTFEMNVGNGGAPVGSFINNGQLLGATFGMDPGNPGATVGFYSGNDPNAAVVNSFTNTNLISGIGTGVAFDTSFNSFNNTGTATIRSTMRDGVFVNLHSGNFNNDGDIFGARFNAIYFQRGTDSFVNGAGALIQNTDALTEDGTAVGFQTDLLNGGPVGSFVNRGDIFAATNSTNFGNGVGFFDNGNGAFVTQSFENTGNIRGTGQGSGVFSKGGFLSFINGPTGNISSDRQAFNSDGFVTEYVNQGNMTSPGNAVTFFGGLGTGSNSGYITSTAAVGEIGVRIDGQGGSFWNSGWIKGATGIAFFTDAGGAGGSLTNSNTIEGTDGNAIAFDYDNGVPVDRADLLRILTGSRIFGNVQFGGGADLLDFAGFAGTTVLHVPGLVEDGTADTEVVSGGRPYFYDAPNENIYIVNPAAHGLVGDVTLDIILPLFDAASEAFKGGVTVAAGDFDGDGANNYVAIQPKSATEAAAAVNDAMTAKIASGRVWGKVFGGVVADGAGYRDAFGGLVAGTHAMLDANNQIGGLAGAVTSTATDGAGVTLTTTTGVVGLYGQSKAGTVEVNYALLGGISGHASSREVIVLGVAETARANFLSYFVAPSVGVASPILENEKGTLKVTAQASLVAGSVEGYTETSPNLSVAYGAGTIGLVDLRAGLEGDMNAGKATITAKVGVFVQSNVGTSTIPVTVLGQTMNAAAVGGGSIFGLYGGVGVTVPVSTTVTFQAGVNGSVANTGLVSADAKVGLSGSF